jgi:hypothetical protein
MHYHALLCSLALAGVITSTQLDAGKDADALAKANLARLQLVQVGKALQAHHIQTNRLPAEADFAEWLTAQLHGIDDAKNDRDPWGTSLRYQLKVSGFSLQSAGPDLAFGTEDDLRYE